MQVAGRQVIGLAREPHQLWHLALAHLADKAAAGVEAAALGRGDRVRRIPGQRRLLRAVVGKT